ncbi:ABC transporter substrate-binding protein [Phyllobacterium endophyticum]|uniref:ABC transporter substrate-binding protein n=1 Tax=Phyllobacterium endophyticum TaxID=1149773 RepID=UPI0011C8BAC7|nr:ABC transporter substrate-binding protein [Phyllobacterium endophyticum]TXR50551.1 ABC transporter substrate-binding protein [Phyllobacterium endophyticum]
MRRQSIIAVALAAIGLASGPLGLTKSAVAGDNLTIVAWGGDYQTMLRKSFFEPFAEKTGIKVNEGTWNAEIAKVSAMVETNTVSWDVVAIGAGLHQMCDQGLLETIDWKKLGLDPAKFGKPGEQNCGLPMHSSGLLIAYDKDKLPDGPKTISDVFDLQKFPGKRGLQKRAFTNLEWALLADGVPAKDVYNVLKTREGVDRAFKKLDTIKKDVIWWTSWSQPTQLLADGEVVMAGTGNTNVYDSSKKYGKNFAPIWDGALQVVDFWVVPKGTPHLDAAYKFLAYFGSPEAQANMTHQTPLSPANSDALALVDPSMKPYLLSSHMEENVLAVDSVFWSEYGNELNERFSAWLAQ